MNKCLTTAISLTLVFGVANAHQNLPSPNEAKYCGYVDLDGNLNQPDNTIRFATFNASLNRAKPGELINDLSTPGNAQAEAVAEIIQRVNPDVLLINEFDFDEAGEALELFRVNYLGIGQEGQQPVEYPYAFLAPSNTGAFSGFDLDNSGSADPKSGNDAFGFGDFEGQYGMVLLSKFPIDEHAARTFQYFLWNDMPGVLLPIDPNTNEPWYSEDELNVVRLSSKSHWDVPVKICHKEVHVLVSHPTPPVFDGPEDHNGLRNFDEIRF